MFYRDGQVICNLLVKNNSFVKNKKIMYRDIVFQFALKAIKNSISTEARSDQEMQNTLVVGDYTLIFEEGKYVGALVLIKNYQDTIRGNIRSSIEKLETMNKRLLEKWDKNQSDLHCEKYFKNLLNMKDN